MKIVSKHPFFVGAAALTFATLALYGCKNFLTDASAPQGTLNQGTLASKTGVSRSMISVVERGESSPTAVVLEKLAAGLGVTMASLFEAATGAATARHRPAG